MLDICSMLDPVVQCSYLASHERMHAHLTGVCAHMLRILKDGHRSHR
jgi:hypothetical protein